MEVMGKKTLWEGRFLRTVLLQYRDRKGSTRSWETVERTGTDGVVIMAPVTSDLRAILIRQYRPALDEYVIELPAGLMEPGESPEETCRRELIEETGYAPGNIRPLSRGVISTGILAEDWHAMLASQARKATPEELASFPPDESEDIEVLNIELNTYHEALTALESEGARIDIRIYGILELAKRALKETGQTGV